MDNFDDMDDNGELWLDEDCCSCGEVIRSKGDMVNLLILNRDSISEYASMFDGYAIAVICDECGAEGMTEKDVSYAVTGEEHPLDRVPIEELDESEVDPWQAIQESRNDSDNLEDLAHTVAVDVVETTMDVDAALETLQLAAEMIQATKGEDTVRSMGDHSDIYS